jgi:hypothetical protein
VNAKAQKILCMAWLTTCFFFFWTDERETKLFDGEFGWLQHHHWHALLKESKCCSNTRVIDHCVMSDNTISSSILLATNTVGWVKKIVGRFEILAWIAKEDGCKTLSVIYKPLCLCYARNFVFISLTFIPTNGLPNVGHVEVQYQLGFRLIEFRVCKSFNIS